MRIRGLVFERVEVNGPLNRTTFTYENSINHARRPLNSYLKCAF